MNKTKTGAQLIAKERKEQIEKHGFSIVNDANYYKKRELTEAALFCIDQSLEVGYGLKTGINWPYKWGQGFRDKILAKGIIGKLTVAGALIAAEIDRLKQINPDAQ